jgi:tripartite-type tricarboxylate transporter receptor subunit TctC
MASPATREALAKVFMTGVVNRSPEEFQQFVLEEIKTWGKVVIDNNIRAE